MSIKGWADQDGDCCFLQVVESVQFPPVAQIPRTRATKMASAMHREQQAEHTLGPDFCSVHLMCAPLGHEGNALSAPTQVRRRVQQLCHDVRQRVPVRLHIL